MSEEIEKLDQWINAIEADISMKVSTRQLLRKIKIHIRSQIYYEYGIIVGENPQYDLGRIEKYIRPILDDVGHKD